MLDTVSRQFQGTAQAFAKSMDGMGLLLIMTALVIYIILGILYESFIHPITILSDLPPAGLAVVGGLLFSQLVTLYLTPVFYTYMESLHAWLTRRSDRRHSSPIAVKVPDAVPASAAFETGPESLRG